MDMQEQNWKNFCTHHLGDWHGTRTRYSPQGEVTESFEAFRLLRANPEQTQITHTNRNIYADGQTEEQSWQFNKQSNNFLDGIMHPITPFMRFLAFDQGAAAGAYKKLEAGAYFGVELFFRVDNLRHSLVIIYGKDGSLNRMTSIREDGVRFPNNYWSSEIHLSTERDLSGNWRGTSVTMTPDLKLSPAVSTQLHWGWEGNETFFCPDGISLSCPSQVSIGTNFTIAANWLVTSSDLQQLIVKYDDSGAFSSVKFEQFHLPDAVGAS